MRSYIGQYFKLEASRGAGAQGVVVGSIPTRGDEIFT